MFAATMTNENADTVTVAVKRLTWRYATRGTGTPRQNDSGRNDGHALVDLLAITLQGQIQAASDGAYWTAHEAVVKAFLVDRGAQAVYKHGTFRVTPGGGSEMYADVKVTSLELPLVIDSQRLTLYTAELECDYGYWRLTAGDAVKKL